MNPEVRPKRFTLELHKLKVLRRWRIQMKLFRPTNAVRILALVMLLLTSACNQSSELDHTEVGPDLLGHKSQDSTIQTKLAKLTADEAKAHAIQMASATRDRHAIDALLTDITATYPAETSMKLTAVNASQATHTILEYKCKTTTSGDWGECADPGNGGEQRSYQSSLPNSGHKGLDMKLGERIQAAYRDAMPDQFGLPKGDSYELTHIFYKDVDGKQQYKWVDESNQLTDELKAAIEAKNITIDSWTECKGHGPIVAASRTNDSGKPLLLCEDGTFAEKSSYAIAGRNKGQLVTERKYIKGFEGAILPGLVAGLYDTSLSKMLSPDGITPVKLTPGTSQPLNFKNRAVALTYWRPAINGGFGSAADGQHSGFVMVVEDDFGQPRSLFISQGNINSVDWVNVWTGPRTPEFKFNTGKYTETYKPYGLFALPSKRRLFTVAEMFGPLAPGAPQYLPIRTADTKAFVTIGEETVSVSIDFTKATKRLYMTKHVLGSNKKKAFPTDSENFWLRDYAFVEGGAAVDTACKAMCAHTSADSSCVRGCTYSAYDELCSQFGLWVSFESDTDLPNGCFHLNQGTSLLGGTTELDKKLEFRSITPKETPKVTTVDVKLTSDDLSLAPVTLKTQMESSEESTAIQVIKVSTALLGAGQGKTIETLAGGFGVVDSVLEAFGFGDDTDKLNEKIDELKAAVNARLTKISATLQKIDQRVTNVEKKLQAQIDTNANAIEKNAAVSHLSFIDSRRKQLNVLTSLAAQGDYATGAFPKRTQLSKYIRAMGNLVSIIDEMDKNLLGLCSEIDSNCVASLIGTNGGDSVDQQSSLNNLRKAIAGYTYFVRGVQLTLALANQVRMSGEFLSKDHDAVLRKDVDIQIYCANFCSDTKAKKNCVDSCIGDRADDIATIQHNVIGDFLERLGRGNKANSISGRHTMAVKSLAHSVISKWHRHMDAYGIEKSQTNKALASKIYLPQLKWPHGGVTPEKDHALPGTLKHDPDVAFANMVCKPWVAKEEYNNSNAGDFIGGCGTTWGESNCFAGDAAGSSYVLGITSTTFYNTCGNLHGLAAQVMIEGDDTLLSAPLGRQCGSLNEDYCGSMAMKLNKTNSSALELELKQNTVWQLVGLNLPTLAMEHGSAGVGSVIDSAARLSTLELTALPGVPGFQSMKSPNKGLIMAIRDARKSMISRLILKVSTDALRTLADQGGCEPFSRFRHFSTLTGLCYSNAKAIGDEFSYSRDACVPGDGLSMFKHMMGEMALNKLVTCSEAELRIRDICPSNYPYRGVPVANSGTVKKGKIPVNTGGAANKLVCYADVADAVSATYPTAASEFCIHEEHLSIMATALSSDVLSVAKTCESNCETAAFGCNMGICGPKAALSSNYSVEPKPLYAPGMVTGGDDACVAQGGTPTSGGNYCYFSTLEQAKTSCSSDPNCYGALQGPGFIVTIMKAESYTYGDWYEWSFHKKEDVTGVQCDCFDGWTGGLCEVPITK